MMVLITADEKVNEDGRIFYLSTSEGLGNISRGAPRQKERALASVELTKSKKIWPLSGTLSPTSAKTFLKVIRYLYIELLLILAKRLRSNCFQAIFWVIVAETHLNQLRHEIEIYYKIMCFKICAKALGIDWDEQNINSYRE